MPQPPDGAAVPVAGPSRRPLPAVVRHARPLGLITMGVLATLMLVWPVLRLPFHLPIGPNEGWNALHTVQAMTGGTLYPPPGSFMVNNYPPLSFYLVGAVGAVVGDNIVAGRLVSLAAVLIVALNLGLIVRCLGAARWAAAFTGLMTVAILGKSFTLYVGVDDPQLLGHAVMTAGFLVFVALPRRLGPLALAAALMVAAGFIKHNIFAMPLAVTTWLLVHDRRTLRRWLALGAGFVAAGFALCLLAYGGAFLDQLLSPRVYDPMRVLRLLGWAQHVAIPIVLWAVYLVQAPQRDARSRLPDHLMAAGFLAFAVTRMGEGVSVNSLFDWVIAACIAGGVALSRLGTLPIARRHGAAVTEAVAIAALCLRLVLLPQHELVGLVTGARSLAALRADSAATDQVAALMRRQPGPGLCEDMALCYWAGHSSAYDAFNAGQAVRTGRRDLAELGRRITAGAFGVIQLYGDDPLLPYARAGMAQCLATARGEVCFGRPAERPAR